MKTKRNLSGLFFRSQDGNGKWGNKTFEDLSEEEQDKYMNGRSEEWLKSLAKQLAGTINKIGDELDLVGE